MDIEGNTFVHVDGTKYRIIDGNPDSVTVINEYDEINKISPLELKNRDFEHYKPADYSEVRRQFPCGTELNTEYGIIRVIGYFKVKIITFNGIKHRVYIVVIRENNKKLLTIKLSDLRKLAREAGAKPIMLNYRVGFEFTDIRGTKFRVIETLGEDKYIIRSELNEIVYTDASHIGSCDIAHMKDETVKRLNEKISVGTKVAVDGRIGEVVGYGRRGTNHTYYIRLTDSKKLCCHTISEIKRQDVDILNGLSTMNYTGHYMRIIKCTRNDKMRIRVEVEGIGEVTASLEDFLKQRVKKE